MYYYLYGSNYIYRSYFCQECICLEKYDILFLMKISSHAQTTEQLETCATHPIGRALRLLGDMWTLMIVHSLLSGPKRFGELHDAMGNVSPKTLSQRLKML